jgi:uncharacterized coiled-coil protein SlyX
VSENVDNIVLEHLKALRMELKDVRLTMLGEFKDVKSRLGTLEAGQASTIQHIGHLGSSIAGQQVAIDRMSERIDRVESRLELTH